MSISQDDNTKGTSRRVKQQYYAKRHYHLEVDLCHVNWELAIAAEWLSVSSWTSSLIGMKFLPSSLWD